MFESGILMDGYDTEQTVKRATTYVTNKGYVLRSIRRVKYNGQVVSVKIVVDQNDLDAIMDSEFWPSGIYCRQWKNDRYGPQRT